MRKFLIIIIFFLQAFISVYSKSFTDIVYTETIDNLAVIEFGYERDTSVQVGRGVDFFIDITNISTDTLEFSNTNIWCTSKTGVMTLYDYPKRVNRYYLPFVVAYGRDNTIYPKSRIRIYSENVISVQTIYDIDTVYINLIGRRKNVLSRFNCYLNIVHEE